MHTKVGIIGGGASGLLLSQMRDLNGIDDIVLERQSRDSVLGRIRAGVLEHGTVELLREAGSGARMDTVGEQHGGVNMGFDDACRRMSRRGWRPALRWRRASPRSGPMWPSRCAGAGSSSPATRPMSCRRRQRRG